MDESLWDRAPLPEPGNRWPCELTAPEGDDGPDGGDREPRLPITPRPSGSAAVDPRSEAAPH
jgi:hypothetical protein